MAIVKSKNVKRASKDASFAAGLSARFKQWEAANTAYLKARYAYDMQSRLYRQYTDDLRLAFTNAKIAVQNATKAYYDYLNRDRPVTLSQLEETKLFTAGEIANMKEKAQALIRAEKEAQKVAQSL